MLQLHLEVVLVLSLALVVVLVMVLVLALADSPYPCTALQCGSCTHLSTLARIPVTGVPHQMSSCRSSSRRLRLCMHLAMIISEVKKI